VRVIQKVLAQPREATRSRRRPRPRILSEQSVGVLEYWSVSPFEPRRLCLHSSGLWKINPTRLRSQTAMSDRSEIRRHIRQVWSPLIPSGHGPHRSKSLQHAGKMLMTIFAGIAEFERDLIRERTGAGREAAKKRGVRFGRPRKLTLDQGELARRLVSEGKAVREIASVFNVHPATIYRLASS
jgi:hypothetical protein